MLSYAKLFKHAWSAWHLSAEDWRLPIFSRRQRHLYWPHSETSLKTQSLRGKMHATWPGVYWIGRVFGSSVGTATGDRLTRRQGIFVKNWDEMSWNEMKDMKDMKEMKCAKQIKSNTMSCSVLGSLVSCSPHLLKAPRTLKVYLSVGEEARPLIDCFSTFCEIVDNVMTMWHCYLSAAKQWYCGLCEAVTLRLRQPIWMVTEPAVASEAGLLTFLFLLPENQIMSCIVMPNQNYIAPLKSVSWRQHQCDSLTSTLYDVTQCHTMSHSC